MYIFDCFTMSQGETGGQPDQGSNPAPFSYRANALPTKLLDTKQMLYCWSYLVATLPPHIIVTKSELSHTPIRAGSSCSKFRNLLLWMYQIDTKMSQRLVTVPRLGAKIIE